MNDSLKKIAAGVVVTMIVNKITPYVETALEDIVQKQKNKSRNN